MICFKDMTFCSRAILLGGDCSNRTCSRHLTEEIDAQNVHDLPLAMADMRTDKCGYLTTEEDK